MQGRSIGDKFPQFLAEKVNSLDTEFQVGEIFFFFPHKCLIPLSSYIISKEKKNATLILVPPQPRYFFLWFLKIFSLCIWFSEVCIWYPRCRCFGIYLSRFLWASWICGLTYDINLEKFSVIIASDISYISFFSVRYSQ